MGKKSKYITVRVLIWLSMFLLFLGTSSYFLDLIPAVETGIASATALVGIALINEFWLFPKYYTKNRKKFILLSIVITLLLSAIYLGVDILIIHRQIPPREKNIPFIFPVLRSLSILLLGNFISIIIMLANELKSNAEREKQLKEEKLGTEIKLLKAQINPHFIFNALNNIYSLSYTKSDKAPDSILKLSEMLRYVFYDCSKDHVKIEKEVEYIKNFIAFQQMKSDYDQNIRFNPDKVIVNHSVSPMLFIPFIENAFKYSNIESETDAYTNIVLESTEKKLLFAIENSVPEDGKIPSGNGTGIPNVQKRLNLLYPGKYELIIKDDGGKYFVSLKIYLS